MVDYNIAIPQQQLFQAPDFTQNAMRMQQMQMQEMQTQELARKSAAARNTQQLYADPNFDQFSPEGIRRLALAGGPKVGIMAATGARQNEQLLQQTALTNAGLEKTRLEIGAKEYDIAQDRLAAIRPGDAKGYAEWDRVHGPAYRANGVNLPTPQQWAQDPTGKLQGHMVSTSQSVRERAAAREKAGQFKVQMTDVGPMATNELGEFRMATELRGGAGAPAVGGAPMGGAGAPAMPGAAAPAAGGEAGYLTGLDRAEGRTKNPYSSADGKFQFINSTFVDTARKAFPVLADKSPAEILTLRGFKLANGKQIEDVLEQRLRADNTQALTSAGIAPTPGNTYLAHFLGAGGARSLLSVDPNTPVSQILDPRAIAANKSVLDGKTAGQVAAWADSKFGGAPGLAASMTAGNQRQGGVGAPSFTPAMGGGMSPTAPTMNNAMALGLMGQQPPQQGNALAMQAAPMLQQQPVPVTTAPAQVGPAPSAYEEALRAARQRELDVYKQKEEIKRSAAQELTPVQEQKMRTDIGEARANAGESMATLQETLRAAKDVLALPEEAKNAISGYTGKYTPNFSASAKDAQTKFNDVVGQITAMSKASAGSIGSMAVQEWKILADQVASLDLTNMDAKTLDRQMKIIINRAEGLMNRTRSNYTNIYGPLMEKYKGQFDLPAATPSIAADIDPRAIEKLRNDPSMAKAFDEHFGRPGAAAAILGK